MEYIKQLFSSNSMLGYGIAFVVVILVLGIIFFFIRRRNLNNQNIGGMGQNSSINNMVNQENGINNVLTQGGTVSTLSKDPTLNTLMNSEELVNNSFVISAEENAAKRISSLANNANIANPPTPTNTATASNIPATSQQAL